jgi:hypothetical protein
VWITWQSVTAKGAAVDTQVVGGGPCSWGAELRCSMPQPLMVASALVVASKLLYCIVFFVYLARAWRQYAKQLYQRYRVYNMLLRIMVRLSNAPASPTCSRASC